MRLLTSWTVAARRPRPAPRATLRRSPFLLICLILVSPLHAHAQQSERQVIEGLLGVNQSARRGDARAGGSTVTGRVFYEGTNRPVRRAKVLLVNAAVTRYGGLVTEGYDAQPNFSGTDRDGAFVFRNVAAGRYFVLVESSGVVSPLLLAGNEIELARGVAAGRFRKEFAEVSVDGVADARVDVRARTGGVITGRAAYGDGAPLTGARVQIFRLEGGVLTALDPNRSVAAAGNFKTDGRGVYRVAGLPAGEYVVRVTERSVEDVEAVRSEGGYNDAALVFAYHPATASLREAARVRVAPGRESADVNVTLPPRMTRTVSGTVVSRRDGAPLPQASVKIKVEEEGYDDSMPPTAVEVLTDDEGRWSISGVPDGRYTLTASRADSSMEEVFWEGETEPPTAPPRRSFVPHTRELKVEGDVEGLAIALGVAASIEGHIVVEGGGKLPELVRFAALAVEEEDGAGRTAAAAAPATGSPAAAPTPPPLLTSDELSDIVDDEDGPADEYDSETGSFRVGSVGEGGVRIRILVPSDARLYVKSVTRKGADLLGAPLVVTEGQRVTGVRVVLARDSGTLAGRVLRPGGGAAGPGAEVILIPVEAARRRVYAATLSAETGRDGSYVVHAPPGEYYALAFRKKEHAYTTVTSEDVRARASSWRRVTLRPNERRTLNLTLAGEK
jgi:hypothetical protein